MKTQAGLYKPTMNLRWYDDTTQFVTYDKYGNEYVEAEHHNQVLQQQWIDELTGNSEWRSIPYVNKTE